MQVTKFYWPLKVISAPISPPPRKNIECNNCTLKNLGDLYGFHAREGETSHVSHRIFLIEFFLINRKKKKRRRRLMIEAGE